MYKAKLPSDGTTVAVKKLKCSAGDLGRMKQFHREITATVVNDNVVSLIGFCVDPPSLVFEFMSGGTLQEVLESEDMPRSITLRRRVLLSL